MDFTPTQTTPLGKESLNQNAFEQRNIRQNASHRKRINHSVRFSVENNAVINFPPGSTAYDRRSTTESLI